MAKFLTFFVLTFLAVQCVFGEGIKPATALMRKPADIIAMGNGDGSGKGYDEACTSTTQCAFPFTCETLLGDLTCNLTDCNKDSDCLTGKFCNTNDICEPYTCTTTSDCKTEFFVCKTVGLWDGTGPTYSKRCAPGPCNKCDWSKEKCENGACVSKFGSQPPPDPCSKCLSTEQCQNDVCVPEETGCTNCASDEVCRGSVCVPKTNPCSECTSSEECKNDVCVPKEEPKKLPTAAIIGGVVGSILLIALICCAVLFFMRKKKNGGVQNEKPHPTATERGTVAPEATYHDY